jgi:small GTP-binding protein
MSSQTRPSAPTYIFKVPVAGDGAVGKTSLIIRYTQGTFSDTYKMTIGTSFAVRTVDFGNLVVKLQIWDLAGQPHFGSVRPLFYQGSTGVIYVFSVADRASFDHLTGWINEVQKTVGPLTGILLGNKADLAEARVVSLEEAQGFAQANGLAYMETSAKLDLNVGDAFRFIATRIIKAKWPTWEPAVPVVIAPQPVPPAPIRMAPIAEPEPTVAPEAPVVEEPAPVGSQPLPTPVVTVKEKPLTPIPPPPFAANPSRPSTLPAAAPPPERAPASAYTSNLIEFAGTNVGAMPRAEFEDRAIRAMRRLGVDEMGVLGTFLRSLAHQGQREVVLQSLERLQMEQSS